MDLGVIITAIIGMATTFTSAWVSWFFTRKKYNSEVDKNVIQNMEEALEFYRKLSDDNKQRLDQITKRNDELEDEIRELRRQVSSMMMMTCKDLTCKVRQLNFELEDTGDEKDN